MVRVLRILVWALVWFVGLSLALVVVFRFVPVPVTAVLPAVNVAVPVRVVSALTTLSGGTLADWNTCVSGSNVSTSGTVASVRFGSNADGVNAALVVIR